MKKRLSEGAGATVTFHFDNESLDSNGTTIKVSDLLISDYYNSATAEDGGYITFDLDKVKEAVVQDYNEYSRDEDELEIKPEDITEINEINPREIPDLIYSWGWVRADLPKDTVLNWEDNNPSRYLPVVEVIFTANGEQLSSIVEVDGEYHISEDVYYAYQDLDNYEDEEEYEESYKERKTMKRKVNETKKPVRGTERKINEANFRGLDKIEYIWHGASSDPEVIYKGKSFNYWDVENAFYELCKADLEETGQSVSLADDDKFFNKWLSDNADYVYSYLDDWMADFTESRKINEGNYDYDNAWLGFCTNIKRTMASNDMPVEEAINSEVEDLVYTSDIINVWKDMPGNLGSRTNEITNLMLQDISEGALDDADFIENLEESKKPVHRTGRKINEISDRTVDAAEDKLAKKAVKAFWKFMDKPNEANRKKNAKADARLSNFESRRMQRDARHGVHYTENGRVPLSKVNPEDDNTKSYNPYIKYMRQERERRDRMANESLAESIVREAHSVLSMNEGEAGELTTWQFSARGFSKAMLNKQSTFGSANLRCIIHENDDGKLVGTVVTDYGMDKATVEEALKKALAENGFRTTAITDLINLY